MYVYGTNIPSPTVKLHDEVTVLSETPDNLKYNEIREYPDKINKRFFHLIRVLGYSKTRISCT